MEGDLWNRKELQVWKRRRRRKRRRKEEGTVESQEAVLSPG